MSGKSWCRYTATERGRSTAGQHLLNLKDEPEKENARRLYEIKEQIASVSFSDLLERVYREHPDMAVQLRCSAAD